LIAEYLLTQDIAPDSAGSHPGAIYAPTWILADEASEPMAVAAEAQRIVDHVQVTEYQHHTEIDEATGTYRTDCSGFASYVLQRVAPAHLAMIPKEPDHAHPRAFKYHAFFSSLEADQAGWHAIRHLVNVRRGDIVAWRHPDPIQPGEDTGHVLVVAARPAVETANTYSVRVYDASHDHYNTDTRTANVTGVGSGTIRLQVDDTGVPVAFQFKIGDQFHTYPIAIGRLEAL
jgi:hypothetical protein